MDLRTNRRITSDSAFTFIEIMLAVILLSAALVVLIGLQTSAVSRALRDRDQQNAMLVARSILAAAELNPRAIPEGIKQQPARELLQSLVRMDETEEAGDATPYMALTSTEEMTIPVPGVTGSLISMRRFMLELSWGDTPDQRLTVSYFIPSELKGDKGTEDEEFVDDE